MKRIAYIAFSIFLLMGAISCTDLLDPSLRGRSDKVKPEVTDFPEGARLTLGFNVPMPVATKAMTEVPKIDSVHVLVFSNNGVSPNGAFLEMQKAELTGLVDKNAIQDYANTDNPGVITNPDEATVIARWKVDLMMGRGIRHLHFVANLPEDFEVPEQGADEFSVMRSLHTTGGNVAYWQMVVVEDGILAYTYDGTDRYQYVDENGIITTRNVSSVPGFVSYSVTDQSYKYTRDGETTPYEVGIGDYITSEGLKVLDGGGYYASLELSRAVNLIPLVRNFARIKVVTTSASNFRITEAALINTPEAGYVAPFDDAANNFVEAYKKAGTTQINHATILATGYPATIPSNHVVTPTSASSITTTGAVTNATTGRDSVYLYMYERGIPTEKATAMLVKGTLAGVGEKWFKIEISDTNGSYFPIYRDFTYEVEIKSINGSEGHDYMQDALDNDAIGDISNSKETETLTQIIDGSGLTLWVEYIDHTSTAAENHSVRLLYKFYKGSEIYTDQVTLRIDPETGRQPAINSTAEELTGSPYTGTDTPDGSSTGWYSVDVPLYGNSDITKVSTLHVEGKLDAKTMFRNVKYRVMAKQDFALSNTGLDRDALDEETTLTIKLPDYLGYSVFPLTLMIEAQNGNLNPADGENLSVESGASLFGGNNNAFYFLKTVEYTDYQTSSTVTCKFKTTQTSGNATWVAVKDKEGYFNTGTDYVSVGPVFMLSADAASVGANETSAKFTLFSTGESNPAWELSSDDTNVTFLPANTGTGSKAITVRFPANTETSSKTYTVTASRTGFDDQTFTITQAAPEFSISSEGVTIGPDATSVSFDITSTSSKTWTVSSDSDEVTLVKTTRAGGNSITGTGNATVTVSVPEYTAESDNRSYTITASCEGFTSKTFTITQQPLTLELSTTSTTVKASETTASFTVNTNSTAAWTITSSEGVSASRSGSTVNVTFPDNLSSDSPVTRTVTVTIGSKSQTFTITHKSIRWETTNKTVLATGTYFDRYSGEYNDISDSEISALSFDYSRNNYNNLSAVGNNYVTLQSSGYYHTTLTVSAKSITKIVITWHRQNWTDYSVSKNNTSIVSGNGSISYADGSGNNNNVTYPTTTWVNDSGSDSVSLQFNNDGTAYVRQIQVFYSHQVE